MKITSPMLRALRVGLLAPLAGLTLSSGAARAALPDLVVTSFSVTPRSVAPGGAIEMVSEIRNAGDAEVPARGPRAASTAVEIRLMTSETAPSGPLLGGWGPIRAIPAGASERYTNHGTVPAGTAPGHYFACVTVDAGHIVSESNESNNRVCLSLTVTGGPTVKPPNPVPGGVRPGIRPGTVLPGALLPDLTVVSVSVGGVSGVSRQATVTVKNVGSAPASHFRVDAFQLVPKRWPLLFTVCPQTSRGGSASCASVWESGTLAAGATRTYSGWVTFPADHKPKTTEKVEFMADGCFPALEPALPAGCRVAESNETNNSKTAAVGVP